MPMLIRYAPNCILIKNGEGKEVLYSYDVPVAVKFGSQHSRWYRTRKHWSRTTRAHIMAALGTVGYVEAKIESQAEIEEMARDEVS